MVEHKLKNVFIFVFTLALICDTQVVLVANTVNFFFLGAFGKILLLEMLENSREVRRSLDTTTDLNGGLFPVNFSLIFQVKCFDAVPL